MYKQLNKIKFQNMDPSDRSTQSRPARPTPPSNCAPLLRNIPTYQLALQFIFVRIYVLASIKNARYLLLFFNK